MAHIQIYDPFAATGFDEVFRGFFQPVRSDRNAPAPVKIDVTEDEKAYTSCRDPGRQEGRDPCRGRRQSGDDLRRSQARVATQGRRASSSQRALLRQRLPQFTMASELDETQSEAKYENGVLELKLAKKPAATGRKLTIQ